jgi:hypothetical protein
MATINATARMEEAHKGYERKKEHGVTTIFSSV